MTDIATPTDSPVSVPIPEQPKKVPARGKRMRVLDGDQGDYCVYEIAQPGAAKIPAGALLPIPTVPKFKNVADATKWIRNESGDKLSGKQVMIFRACEILSLTVQMKPTVVIQSKPKKVTNQPAAETSEGQ